MKAEWSEVNDVYSTSKGACNLDDATGGCGLRSTPTGVLACRYTRGTATCWLFNDGPLPMKEEGRAKPSIREDQDVRDVYMQELCAVSDMDKEDEDVGDTR